MIDKLLFATCSGCALVSVGLVAYANHKAENKYRDTQFFKDALSILGLHPSAIKLLGTPVSGSRVTRVITESTELPNLAKFTAEVKGPRSTGTMYFWAEKINLDGNEKIEISRIEFQPKNEKFRRILVKGQI